VCVCVCVGVYIYIYIYIYIEREREREREREPHFVCHREEHVLPLERTAIHLTYGDNCVRHKYIVWAGCRVFVLNMAVRVADTKF
jgi:hypothetical protein